MRYDRKEYPEWTSIEKRIYRKIYIRKYENIEISWSENMNTEKKEASGKKSHEKKWKCMHLYIRSEKCLAKNIMKKSDKNECKKNRDEVKRKKPARKIYLNEWKK